MVRGVAQSGKATGNDKLRVFISYSRRDAAAAEAIVAALTERGFEVKIDTRDLPFGEEWQKELAEFIRLSDTVIWLVSEASIRSDWVNWELDEVKDRNKRLVPVMVGLVNPAELPRQLGKIHILPPDRVFDLARDLDTLVAVLETDHAWLKQATRWQDRASVWLANGRTSGRLLTSAELADAERWQQDQPKKAPTPSPEVLDLMLASRKAATKRQRWVLGSSLVGTLGALALAGFAYLQREAAVEQRNIALTTTSKVLASEAHKLVNSGNPDKALLVALEALPASTEQRPHVWEAERAAYAALHESRHVSTVNTPPDWGDVSLEFSADGRLLFGSSEFTDKVNAAKLWRVDTGQVVEPRRVCRRLQILRDWSHEESHNVTKVFTGGA